MAVADEALGIKVWGWNDMGSKWHYPMGMMVMNGGDPAFGVSVVR